MIIMRLKGDIISLPLSFFAVLLSTRDYKITKLGMNLTIVEK